MPPGTLSQRILREGELMEDNRVWLRVPFVEKEQAARLGAIWCPDHGRWFVPDSAEMSSFSRWMDHDEVVPEDWYLGGTMIGDQGGAGRHAERC